MIAMRRAWIAAVGLFGIACFAPTDIDGSSVSDTGDTGSTGASSTDPSTMTEPDPSMTTENTMTDPSTETDPTNPTDPSTMTDPTAVDASSTDEPSTSDAPTTTGDPGTTGMPTTTEDPTTETGLECTDDADCPGGTCVDDVCVDDPPPGDPYGPCDACDADEVEIELVDIPGCYCAPACAMSSDCPIPADGTAIPECAVSAGRPEPTLCALLCDPAMMDVCPTGATCQPVPMQDGVGVCTYPV